MSPATRDEFDIDLGVVKEAVRAGVVPGTARAADLHWDRWCTFCEDTNIDPWLYEIYDPVPLLQVYGQRYRDGRVAPRGKPVRAGTVSDALRAIGQAFTSVGAKDPRKNTTGQIDFRLQRQDKSYKRFDPPPDRVKPVPIQVVMHALAAAYGIAGTIALQCIADMCCIAFFFLLRPGEYTGTKGGNTCPFKLEDVQLFIGARRLDLLLAPIVEIQTSTSASLTFTNQKNGVRGEVISHSKSGSVLTCPVTALTRRVIHLRENNATLDTPLATYYTNKKRAVTAKDVTETLQHSVLALGPNNLGFLSKDVSARALRAGGATALMCAGVDHTNIRMLGRWQSDAMLRYLHLSAQPVMRRFASLMLTGGNFFVEPGQEVPMF